MRKFGEGEGSTRLKRKIKLGKPGRRASPTVKVKEHALRKYKGKGVFKTRGKEMELVHTEVNE